MFKGLIFIVFVSLFLGGCGENGPVNQDNKRVENKMELTPSLDNLSTKKDINIGVIDHITSISVDEIQDKLRASTVKIKIADAWGSGFFIGNGYIVTNNHVATYSNDLKVDVEGEFRLLDAQLIAHAECADLAVIRLDLDGNYEHLNWSRKSVSAGMHIASAGFPWDVTTTDGESQYTYTEGIINTDSSIQNSTWASPTAFYHSAKVAGGNSGGPVIELETGKVVGVNYAGKDDRQLAIDGKFAQNYVLRMINGKNINSIGISPDVYISTSMDKSFGVFVESVVADGKASKIGIRAGDFIDSIGHFSLEENINMSYEQIRKVRTLEQYCDVLKNYNVNNGDVLPITITRITDNHELYECQGEINGKYLTNISDGSRCPTY